MAFKNSKQQFKSWEEKFVAEHNRKPRKQDMKEAPDYVQAAYKNCYKIKDFFAKTSKSKEVCYDSHSTDITMNMSTSTTMNIVNKPFCSGSCDEIHARTKLQNKTSLYIYFIHIANKS